MINTQTSQQITKIYLVTNCFGDPNKVYIGQTRNCRYWKHKQTFGSSINYDYIDEVNSLNSKEWKPLESYWIEQFTQWGFNVQNKNRGGNGPTIYSEEAKLKISNSNKGKKRSEETKQKMRKPKSESHKINLSKPKPWNKKINQMVLMLEEYKLKKQKIKYLKN